MNKIVSDRLDEIGKICVNYGVVCLDLFGSAASGKFDTASSDLDFVYDMKRGEKYADRFFGLENDLKTLFGRKVDLVSYRSLRNPFLKKEIDRTKVRVYGLE